MKPNIATIAALTLATGVALAGSAATAGTSITINQNGVTYSTSNSDHRHASRGHNRNLGARHELHFGHPFLGNSKRHGASSKFQNRRLKSHHRHSNRHGKFRRH